jgi:signal transduction histidine kinase
MHFANEINSVENERSRISRDLHDSAAPLLGFSKAHVNEVNAASEEDRAHIEKANEAMDRLMRQMKDIATNLSPSSLSRKGLHYALEDFFEDCRQAFSLPIVFVYEVSRGIPQEAAIHLYRIVQEITHNTIKHSKAKKLRVHFKEKKQKLYLLCKDDGIGFDPEQVDERSKSLGLVSLKSRTELLKGKLRCKSKLKYGTEYFFEFPFEGTMQSH